MLVFLTLLLSSLLLYTIRLNNIVTYKATLFILSLFMSNAVDLISITYLSIKSELDVKEIFRI